MRKVLASLFLGAALLTPCGTALAEPSRSEQAGWGIRPEKTAPTLLDLARWLSDRFRRAASPADVEPTPVPAPAPGSSPAPGLTPDIVCPERVHCPIG